MSHACFSRLRAAGLTASLVLACVSARADTVLLSGTRFDVSYDNSGFIYQTGTTPDPDTGTPVALYEQIGGFSLVAPDTVRYSLRPREVFGDPATIVPNGIIQVGGSAWSSDSVGDGAGFTLLPHAGNHILGVQMLTAGTYDNSGTESATLVYAETLHVAGDSDGRAASLGVFSSGSLPTGSNLNYAGLTSPFGVTFDFTLEGSSSSFDFISSASVSYIDFKITASPVAEPEAWALILAGMLGIGMASKRRPA